MIFNLLYGSAKVKNKTTFVLFCVCKILYLLFSHQVVYSCTVFLVNKCLTSQKNAVARYDIELVEDDNITRYKFMRADSFEPRILIIYENVLLIFYIVCLFLLHLYSHLELLFNLLNSIEIILKDLTFMLIYLRFIFT